MEGYEKLGLSNTEVERLRADPLYSKLRAYRAGTYHFREKYFHDDIRCFLSEKQSASWLVVASLVDELNKLLREPAVTTATGGVMGGGTTITPIGEKTIALYHSVEAHTRTAARSEFQAFRKLMRG
jgi:molybdate transport repressor ModE-like protein